MVQGVVVFTYYWWAVSIEKIENQRLKQNIDHKKYIQRTFYLAKKGKGRVAPNPLVGCVIVKNNIIIGEGYHKKFGENHAEIDAFKNCIEDPTDASLYVTLEPCSHHGKTGPCCNVIAENGIRDVYISMLDPNEKVNGKGVDYLESKGIFVQSDILLEESRKLNKGYLNWIKYKRPYVIGKLAQDNRGFIAKKGSVSLNGISLTVNQVKNDFIVLNIIPFTWLNTNLKGLKIGDRINLEVDMLARYVTQNQ